MPREYLDTWAQVTDFIGEHGKPLRRETRTKYGEGAKPLRLENDIEGTEYLHFAGGWLMAIISDYQPDYSDLTPGEGWTLQVYVEEL